MSEASPRPWSTDGDVIHDANGHAVAVVRFGLGVPGQEPANAALIVAAVNAYESLHVRGCALPENHGGPCLGPSSLDALYPLFVAPPPGPAELAAMRRAFEQSLAAQDRCHACTLGVQHDGPCSPESLVNVEAMPDGTLRKRDVPLRSDCRLPLAHAPGCECGRL